MHNVLQYLNGNFDSQSAQYKYTVKMPSSIFLKFILSFDGRASI